MTQNKPIYTNPKSGKFYTFDDDGQGNRKILTAFPTKDVDVNKAPLKADKNGKAYRVLPCEKFTLKNGIEAYRILKDVDTQHA